MFRWEECLENGEKLKESSRVFTLCSAIWKAKQMKIYFTNAK